MLPMAKMIIPIMAGIWGLDKILGATSTGPNSVVELGSNALGMLSSGLMKALQEGVGPAIGDAILTLKGGTVDKVETAGLFGGVAGFVEEGIKIGLDKVAGKLFNMVFPEDMSITARLVKIKDAIVQSEGAKKIDDILGLGEAKEDISQGAKKTIGKILDGFTDFKSYLLDFYKDEDGFRKAVLFKLKQSLLGIDKEMGFSTIGGYLKDKFLGILPEGIEERLKKGYESLTKWFMESSKKRLIPRGIDAIFGKKDKETGERKGGYIHKAMDSEYLWGKKVKQSNKPGDHLYEGGVYSGFANFMKRFSDKTGISKVFWKASDDFKKQRGKGDMFGRAAGIHKDEKESPEKNIHDFFAHGDEPFEGYVSDEAIKSAKRRAAERKQAAKDKKSAQTKAKEAKKAAGEKKKKEENERANSEEEAREEYKKETGYDPGSEPSNSPPGFEDIDTSPRKPKKDKLNKKQADKFVKDATDKFDKKLKKDQKEQPSGPRIKEEKDDKGGILGVLNKIYDTLETIREHITGTVKGAKDNYEKFFKVKGPSESKENIPETKAKIPDMAKKQLETSKKKDKFEYTGQDIQRKIKEGKRKYSSDLMEPEGPEEDPYDFLTEKEQRAMGAKRSIKESKPSKTKKVKDILTKEQREARERGRKKPTRTFISGEDKKKPAEDIPIQIKKSVKESNKKPTKGRSIPISGKDIKDSFEEKAKDIPNAKSKDFTKEERRAQNELKKYLNKTKETSLLLNEGKVVKGSSGTTTGVSIEAWTDKEMEALTKGIYIHQHAMYDSFSQTQSPADISEATKFPDSIQMMQDPTGGIHKATVKPEHKEFYRNLSPERRQNIADRIKYEATAKLQRLQKRVRKEHNIDQIDPNKQQDEYINAYINKLWPILEKESKVIIDDVARRYGIDITHEEGVKTSYLDKKIGLLQPESDLSPINTILGVNKNILSEVSDKGTIFTPKHTPISGSERKISIPVQSYGSEFAKIIRNTAKNENNRKSLHENSLGMFSPILQNLFAPQMSEDKAKFIKQQIEAGKLKKKKEEEEFNQIPTPGKILPKKYPTLGGKDVRETKLSEFGNALIRSPSEKLKKAIGKDTFEELIGIRPKFDKSKTKLGIVFGTELEDSRIGTEEEGDIDHSKGKLIGEDIEGTFVKEGEKSPYEEKSKTLTKKQLDSKISQLRKLQGYRRPAEEVKKVRAPTRKTRTLSDFSIKGRMKVLEKARKAIRAGIRYEEGRIAMGEPDDPKKWKGSYEDERRLQKELVEHKNRSEYYRGMTEIVEESAKAEGITREGSGTKEGFIQYSKKLDNFIQKEMNKIKGGPKPISKQEKARLDRIAKSKKSAAERRKKHLEGMERVRKAKESKKGLKAEKFGDFFSSNIGINVEDILSSTGTPTTVEGIAGHLGYQEEHELLQNLAGSKGTGDMVDSAMPLLEKYGGEHGQLISNVYDKLGGSKGINKYAEQFLGKDWKQKIAKKLPGKYGKIAGSLGSLIPKGAGKLTKLMGKGDKAISKGMKGGSKSIAKLGSKALGKVGLGKVGSKVGQKVLGKMGPKVLGKIAAKAVPFLGTAVSALDIITHPSLGNLIALGGSLLGDALDLTGVGAALGIPIGVITAAVGEFLNAGGDLGAVMELVKAGKFNELAEMLGISDLIGSVAGGGKGEGGLGDLLGGTKGEGGLGGLIGGGKGIMPLPGEETKGLPGIVKGGPKSLPGQDLIDKFFPNMPRESFAPINKPKLPGGMDQDGFVNKVPKLPGGMDQDGFVNKVPKLPGGMPPFNPEGEGGGFDLGKAAMIGGGVLGLGGLLSGFFGGNKEEEKKPQQTKRGSCVEICSEGEEEEKEEESEEKKGFWSKGIDAFKTITGIKGLEEMMSGDILKGAWDMTPFGVISGAIMGLFGFGKDKDKEKEKAKKSCLNICGLEPLEDKKEGLLQRGIDFFKDLSGIGGLAEIFQGDILKGLWDMSPIGRMMNVLGDITGTKKKERAMSIPEMLLKVLKELVMQTDILDMILLSTNPLGYAAVHAPGAGGRREGRMFKAEYQDLVGQATNSMTFRSPLTINKGFKGGMPSGEVVFPQLDPDLFKRKAEETGMSLAGKGGKNLVFQPGSIVIQSEDPEKISKIVHDTIINAAKKLEE
jgi:hypothetical protein